MRRFPGSRWFRRAGAERFTQSSHLPTKALRCRLEELEGRDVPATYTLFDTSVAPGAPAATFDTSPVTLGVEFTVETTGIVNTIKFYRQVEIGSGYSASLWKADGTRLASGIVVEGQGPTPGWQSVYIGNVTVEPGETYVASYHASRGGYSYSYDYFNGSGIDAGPLDAPANEFGPNGLYRYGTSSSTFPSDSYRASNYWVTPVFTTTDNLPTITAISPNRGPTTGNDIIEITGTNFTASGTRESSSARRRERSRRPRVRGSS